MKFYTKLILLVICFQGLFSSCHKTDNWNASHPRLISLNSKMNISDAENAGISFTVEFYDEDNGERVSSFVWEIEYEGKKILMERIEEHQFVKHSKSGLPSVTFDWTFLEILEKLELEQKEINSHSEISFVGTLNRDDGLSYTHFDIGNIDPYNNGFEGFYFFKPDLTCENDYSGIIHESTKVCGNTFEGHVEWKGGPGNYILEKDKGITSLVRDCYLDDSVHESYSISIGDFCDLFSLNLNYVWGYDIYISELVVEGATLKLVWDYGCTCCELIPTRSCETIWTRLDGKEWSPDLFLE